MNKIPKHSTAVLVLFAITVTFATSGAVGAIIASHQGAAEPLTEGWTNAHFIGTTLMPGHVSPGVAVGPVIGDMGFDAWQVDDNSTAPLSSGGYAYEVSASELDAALSNGFRLSTRLSVVDTPDVAGGSVFVVFSTGSTRWQMVFGSDDDGDPIVALVEEQGALGPTFTLEGSAGGYHLYDLVFDPLSATASLFVDGVERLTGYDGRSLSETAPYVFWGSGQRNDIGEGRYNLVELSAVPIPAALWLFASGIAGLGLLTHPKRQRS